MNKPAKKCANPACDCLADEGSKYCSAHCEGAAGTTEVICRCGHPGCGGEATTLAR
jgi:metallothionein